MRYQLVKKDSKNKEEILIRVNSISELNKKHMDLAKGLQILHNLDYGVGYFLQDKEGNAYLWKDSKTNREVKMKIRKIK